MKIYILRAAILFIALFSFNFLYSSERDSTLKKEINSQLFFGSDTRFSGVFFTGSFSYLKNHTFYSLQYNYFGSNYVNLKYYDRFLLNINSLSSMIGYNIPINNFSFDLSLGITFGSGRFSLHQTSNYNFLSSDKTAYFKTGFIGLICRGSIKYLLTDRISLGFLFNKQNNYYFQYQESDSYESKNEYKFKHLSNLNGLQILIEYKLKQWKTSRL